jgi:hypothetical protein
MSHIIRSSLFPSILFGSWCCKTIVRPADMSHPRSYYDDNIQLFVNYTLLSVKLIVSEMMLRTRFELS